MTIRTLQQEELVLVTGASGGYDPSHAGASARASQRGGRSGASKSTANSGGGFYASLGDDVTNCNNGIIGGMIAGSLGGLAGIAVGLAGGVISGGCFKNSGNGGGGGSGSNNSNCSGDSCSF